MSHSRRTHAGIRQAVVEPGRRAVTEISTHRLLNRREHLQQNKEDAHKDEAGEQRITMFDRRYEDAHRDGKDGRQHAPQHNDQPPHDRERAVRRGSTAKNFHSLRTETLEHGFRVTSSRALRGRRLRTMARSASISAR